MDKVDVPYKMTINYEKHFDTWTKPLAPLLESNYMYNLMVFLHELYKSAEQPRPLKREVFQVFREVPYAHVRVVILSDEPFTDMKGNGIALATAERALMTPSEITDKVHECVETTIYKGCRPGFDLTLEPWLKQGVFPMHAALTTGYNKPREHVKIWREFTRYVIKRLSNSSPGLIFILLGKEAGEYRKFISETDHYVLTYHTPKWSAKQNVKWNCPLFKRANDILIKNTGSDSAIVW